MGPVLVVTHERDLGEEVRHILSTHAATRGQEVILVVGEAEGREVLLQRIEDGTPVGLMIAEISMPVDVSATASRSGPPGVRLVKLATKSLRMATPSVLLTTGEMDRVLCHQLLSIEAPIKVVSVDLNFEQEIRSAIQAVLTSPTSPALRPDMGTFRPSLVRIDLHEETRFEVVWHNKQGRMHDSGLLDIQPSRIDRFIEDAERLRTGYDKNDYRSWENKLRELGEDIYNDFCRSARFRDCLKQALGAAGSRDNIFFTFRTNKARYPILFEAMVERGDNAAQFLMLDAPLCRRLHGAQQWSQIAQLPNVERQTLRCLVVKSDISGAIPTIGVASGPPGGLQKLRHLDEECRSIVDLGRDDAAGPDRRVQFRVKLLDKADPQKSFKATVRDALRSQRWDIVHYAGHTWADFDHVAEKAFIYLPSPDPVDRIEPVALAEFAGWARGTQMIYLSSCQSASERVVYSLAASQIPIIIGFRWPANDEAAKVHAEEFYRAYMRSFPFAEQAFLRARREVKLQFPYERSWAASVLIFHADMQAELYPSAPVGVGEYGSMQ